MSFQEYRNSAWAFRELMKRAEEEIKVGGELKAAKVLYRQPHPRRVLIGQFKARLLRMARKERA